MHSKCHGKKAYVEIGDGQVHYRYVGTDDGSPTVVCFHQNPNSSQMFEEFMESLVDDYYLVAPDMPGYGQSFTPGEIESFDYYTEVLGEAIDAIGVKKFHVVGHHTGAGIGVEMATNGILMSHTDCCESVRDRPPESGRSHQYPVAAIRISRRQCSRSGTIRRPPGRIPRCWCTPCNGKCSRRCYRGSLLPTGPGSPRGVPRRP